MESMSQSLSLKHVAKSISTLAKVLIRFNREPDATMVLSAMNDAGFTNIEISEAGGQFYH